jgi:L-fuconolactonase
MTQMRVIDAHQHVWNLDRADYPFLRPVATLYRTFEEPEIEPLLDASGVDATVLVQSMDSEADTLYMLDVAERWSRVAGVVGWVPLDRADEASAALDRFATRGPVLGIRHLIHEDPDPDWLLRPDVQDGLSLLADRRVTFDVVAVLPRHLERRPRTPTYTPRSRASTRRPIGTRGRLTTCVRTSTTPSRCSALGA